MAESGEPESRQRLSPLVPEDLSAEQRRVYDAAQARRGGAALLGDRIAGPLLAWLHAPLIGETQRELGTVLRFKLALTPRIAEIIILQVAQEAQSAFQIVAHERMAYDAGLTLAQIRALREEGEPELEDPTEQTAWRATRLIITRGDLDDRTYAEAVAAFGEGGVVELVTLVGYYRLLALQMRVFQVPVSDYRGPKVPDRE